jgi:hypothetical protein
MEKTKISRNTLRLAWVLAAFLAVSGCASGETGSSEPVVAEMEAETSPSPDLSVEEEPAAEPEVVTAAMVAEALECSIFVEFTFGEEIPGITTSYDCTSLDGDGPVVFIFEAASEEALQTWLDSGDLEVGSEDTVIALGYLAVLVTEKNDEVLSRLEALGVSD